MIYLDEVIERFKKQALRHRKKLYLFGALVLAYILIMAVVVIMGKSISFVPKAETKFTQLDIFNYLKSFRKFDRDFEVSDVYFVKNYLSVTVKLLYKPQTEQEVKNLAVDIVLGLSRECPEIGRLKAKIIRRDAQNKPRKYGYAVYVKETGQINWVGE